VTHFGRLNPAPSSPGVPILSPIPRRDSIEFRGRTGSTAGLTNGIEPHGLERVLESLKFENQEFKKIIRELDDRCIYPIPVSLTTPRHVYVVFLYICLR
jgi:hypothetical protein